MTPPLSIAELRREYARARLDEKDVSTDPFQQFGRWFAEAQAAETVEVNAMVLATATAAGRPSARVVLLRGFDERGFVFFTDYRSRKGEELEANPARFLPEIDEHALEGDVVRVDLTRPMSEILRTLSAYPIRTRLSLSGTMIVARDIAHAKIKELLDRGEPMPAYMKDYMVYYAGPAKTPEGYASGSFGPTTAGRMDSYVDQFQAAGGSMISVAKGNRSPQVRDACKKHGGFYLASIGGSAANLAEFCIKKVEVQEYPELGMEAIWRIEVEDFPAFIVIDDKGNDFFKELNLG